MDGKEILDRAVAIIARTDVDRPQLLFYINGAMKDILRDKPMARFQNGITFNPVSGIVSIPNLKNIYMVRWDNDVSKAVLKKLPSIEYAYGMYESLEESGVPVYYFLNDNGIRIVPAPLDTDHILVVGEYWPSDLTDDISSTNIYSMNMPLALAYIGAAEYMDFLQEEKRGEYWRGKGLTLVDAFLKALKLQEMTNINNMPRDPLGNMGIKPRTQTVESATFKNDYGVY